MRPWQAAIGPVRTHDDKSDGYSATIRGIVFWIGGSARGTATHFWSLQTRNLLQMTGARLCIAETHARRENAIAFKWPRKRWEEVQSEAWDCLAHQSYLETAREISGHPFGDRRAIEPRLCFSRPAAIDFTVIQCGPLRTRDTDVPEAC